MKQLREKLSKSATKPEPDAHLSRHVMEEEEEVDTTGLDDIPTLANGEWRRSAENGR